VTCQIEVLRTCISLNKTIQALKSLPKTIDETYERVLLSIPTCHSRDALRILQWLAFSTRPLRTDEVAELLVADPEVNPEFDPDRRPFDPQEIASYCGSLVTTQVSTKEIKLAHYSVQEFLVSDRLSNRCEIYKIVKEPANSSIVKTCLAYLTGAFELRVPDIRRDFPLAGYAAENWMKHAKTAEGTCFDEMDNRVVRFLESELARSNWIELFNPDISQARVVHPPLYCASLAGLHGSVKVVLDHGVDINAQGGLYHTALQAASRQGHEAVVQLLLEKGADINTWGGRYDTALHGASYYGHEAVVQLLLEKGADINRQGGFNGTALQAASYKKHETIVQLLLDKGANISAQDGIYGTALQGASYRGIRQ
jgi:hypothetical protein